VTDIGKKEYVDALLKLYGDQVAHTRHHETMRAQSVNYVLVASVAMISVLAADRVFGSTLDMAGRLAITILVVVLNAYGVILSRKHSERGRVHSRVAGQYRRQVSLEMEAAGFPATETLRERGRQRAKEEFPVLHRVHLHRLWEWLHFIIILMAVALFAVEVSRLFP
jgi:hypothetical protein